jgi:hypothetical protein
LLILLYLLKFNKKIKVFGSSEYLINNISPSSGVLVDFESIT